MKRIQANTGRTRQAAACAVLGALLIGGCSSSTAGIGREGPNYLGASDVAPTNSQPAPPSTKITSSKVLSAIVFERVTGLEIDPARLVER